MDIVRTIGPVDLEVCDVTLEWMYDSAERLTEGAVTESQVHARAQPGALV
jgi:hypothetical protein